MDLKIMVWIFSVVQVHDVHCGYEAHNESLFSCSSVKVQNSALKTSKSVPRLILIKMSPVGKDIGDYYIQLIQ